MTLVLALILLVVIGGLAFSRVWLRLAQARRLEAIYEKLRHLLVSEEEQLVPYGSLSSYLKSNVYPRLVGKMYGISPNDPIRANGPFGELVYISRLMTQSGRGFVGHRLGSIKDQDVYEVVSTDFETWMVLWFDMYWTTKDFCAPFGLRLAETDGPWPDVGTVGLSASNRFMPRFPDGFWPDILEVTKDLIGFPLVKPGLKSMQAQVAKRPPAHSRLLKHIVVMVRAQGIDDDS